LSLDMYATGYPCHPVPGNRRWHRIEVILAFCIDNIVQYLCSQVRAATDSVCDIIQHHNGSWFMVVERIIKKRKKKKKRKGKEGRK
jgi:hypothetical protein